MKSHIRYFNMKDINITNLAILLAFLCVICLTVGFAGIQRNIFLDDIGAVLRIEKDIRITDLRRLSIANGAESSGEDFNYDFITSSVVLPNSNSQISYDVEITNIGNIEMGLQSITGLPNNLEYNVIGYTMEAALCDDNNNSKCSLGSVTTIHLTIGYAENGYNGVDTNYNINLTFDFQEMRYTARIGSQYYLTIQDAIDAAPTDGTETTIVLLKNVYQRIKIWRGNNIVLDMPNLVLHNKEFEQGTTGDPVVEIFGARDKNHASSDGTVGTSIFKMINGTILTEANQGAINVELGGTFIMTGGSILASGNRQAVYVKAGGTANISGTSYLSATAEIAPNANPPNYRATVQNFAGNLIITGGTIEAVGPNGIALTSESTTTIGSKDGTVVTTTPTFTATDTGVYIKDSTTFNFYDGIIKGEVAAFNNESEVDDIETGFDIAHSGQTIDNKEYHTAFLGETVVITFNPNGGTLPASELTRNVAYGGAIGPLPVPTYVGYDLVGWYDSNNQLVQPGTTFTEAATLRAEWREESVALIVSTGERYSTLQAAINAAPANTKTTIQLTKSTSEKVTISSNKNIEFDFNPYSLTNPDTAALITNNGTLEIIGGSFSTTSTSNETIVNNTSGTLRITGGSYTANGRAVILNKGTMYMTGGSITTASSNNAAVNNNTANSVLEISGGTITATGQRQAIWNESGGRVTISGTTNLSAKAKVESSNKRGTVQNQTGSTLIITGGTINSTATNGIGVTNNGTATIGTDDGTINSATPIMMGDGNGLYNNGTCYFYDGIFKGKSAAIQGTTPSINSSTTLTDGQDGAYYTKYLQ